MIDLFDRLYFSIEFHCQVGWKSDFLDVIFKIALNNAWVMYNSIHPIQLSLADFMAAVSEELIVSEM